MSSPRSRRCSAGLTSGSSPDRPRRWGRPRLALQAAADLLDEFRHGAFFVSLAPIRDPTLVILTIAKALAVTEGAGRSLSEAVGEFLRERPITARPR